jgi:4-diphosphocytidyl-2-C-methyl-D-erythritol kinase
MSATRHPFLPGVHRALAPAKINLGLFLGPVRASDGKHQLASVMQSISLADELTLELAGGGTGTEAERGAAQPGDDRPGDDRPGGGERDEVICPAVPGRADENLVALALRAFRASTGWRAPPLRLTVTKRIPVAAGLGGGSADAAAALRLAAHASGLGDRELLQQLAAQLGADVPAQISPGRWLASGAGERLHELPSPRSSFGVLVLALDTQLSTAAVYAEADRLGLSRTAHELTELQLQMRSSLEHGAPLPAATELLHNDLQRAAVSLCPPIAEALAQVRDTGAEHVLVSGSGPTVLGLFAHAGRSVDGGLVLARAAAAQLDGRVPAPICAVPVDAAFARATSDVPVRHNSSHIHD